MVCVTEKQKHLIDLVSELNRLNGGNKKAEKIEHYGYLGGLGRQMIVPWLLSRV